MGTPNEHIRKGFTNFREVAGAGGNLDKYFLSALVGGQVVSIDEIPALTLPCNYLSTDDSGGYHPPVEHINSKNASLHTTSFTLGYFSYEAEIENDGLTDTLNQLNFPANTHPYIYQNKLYHSMRIPDGGGAVDSTQGTIELGNGADDIVDDYGPVDGLTINMDGAQVFLVDWDKTLDSDKYLVNAPYAGASNEHNLPSEIENQICKDRASLAEKAEEGRIEHCEYHMANSEPHDHAASNTPPSCGDFDPSNAYNNCYDTCRVFDEVNQSWLSDCNPCVDASRRVDLAHECGCGGKNCKGEDIHCGWELILNAEE